MRGERSEGVLQSNGRVEIEAGGGHLGVDGDHGDLSWLSSIKYMTALDSIMSLHAGQALLQQ